MVESEIEVWLNRSERLYKLIVDLPDSKRCEFYRVESIYYRMLRRYHLALEIFKAVLDGRKRMARSIKGGLCFSVFVFFISSFFVEDVRRFLIINIFGSIGFLALLPLWFLKCIECGAIDRQLFDIETEIRKNGLDTIDYGDPLWDLVLIRSDSSVSALSAEDQCKRLEFMLNQKKTILADLGVDDVWKVWC